MERDEEVDVLRGLVEELRRENEGLRQRNAELERRLQLDSTTSSKPPSSDLPWKPRPSAAKVPKASSAKRGRGGHARVRLAPTRVHDLFPTHCRHCGAELCPTDVVAKPWVHQVTETAGPDGPEVDEYRRQELRCGRCAKRTRATLPANVPSSAFGPRLMATIVTLNARYRLSVREVQSALRTFWSVDISLGAICGTRTRTSERVREPVQQVRAAILQSPAVHIDETGWRKGPTRPWLWTLTTAELSTFFITDKRNKDIAATLLSGFSGIVVSDDHSVYQWIPVKRRQLCWSHRLRDLDGLALYPYDAACARIAKKLASIGRRLIHLFHRMGDPKLSPSAFARHAKDLRKRFEKLCKTMARARPDSMRRKARRLLRHVPALWNFTKVRGLEPTNNNAERRLRHPVLWRKGSFGHVCEQGRLYVERLLTVAQTLRQQGRNVFQWLVRALTPGAPTPSLLPTRGPPTA